MATETLVKQYNAGETVYFVLRNAAGEYFDFDAGELVFQALGSCVAPYLAATERILKAGAAESEYVADIDLDDIAPGLAAVECFALAILQAGGSPDLAADLVISQPAQIIAQLGQLGRRVFDIKWCINVKTTSGTAIQVWAELLADGVPVDLKTIDDAATCEVDIVQHGNSPLLSISTAEMGAVNVAHRFEAEVLNPNFTADRMYAQRVTINADGQTFVRDRTVVVVP